MILQDNNNVTTKESFMTNVVQVQIKDNYGRIVYYPANERAQVAARMFKQKTLTESNLKDLADLGLEVQIGMLVRGELVFPQ